MPPKIQVLSESIARGIAAGEVVERPASVVKELMENAIDAGAAEIVVDLEHAGLKRIRVYDSGEGMDPEDAPAALMRYATSKIRALEDLFNIRTLGFRGEALPSIAAVSHLTVRTRPPHALIGTQVICEGGEIRSISEIGCPVGTEVIVTQLFFNLPVKRKFLRSIRSELHQALHHFLKLSLAYPSISFRFIHDGRMLHELLKTSALEVRVEAVLGRETLSHLRRVESRDGEVAVSGYASLPTLQKGTGDGLSLYVNRRHTKDRMIYRAIVDAYRHVLPAGKFPVVLLAIEVPPSAVDVNVHPTKAEVRFRDPERVFRAVSRTLSSILETTPAGREEAGGQTELRPLGNGEGFDQLHPLSSGSEAPLWVRESGGMEKAAARIPSLQMVGQVYGTYLLCEGQEGLIIIDQHAAHERMLYERYRKDYETRPFPVIRFLVPPLLELSAEEAFLLSSSLDEFEALGFELDEVGEKLFALRGVPSCIPDKEAPAVIREMLEELALRKREGKATDTIEAMLITLSCHTAVRGQFAMRREEMEELVGRLSSYPRTTTCPHGRPLFVVLSWDELRRQFKRSR